MDTDEVDGVEGFEANGSPAEPNPRSESLASPAGMNAKRMKLDLGNGLPVHEERVRVGFSQLEDRVPMEGDVAADVVEQNGIDLVEDEAVLGDFQFPAPVPSNFAKFTKNPSLPEMLETISLPHTQRSQQLARADICPQMQRAQLVTNNSRLKTLYGFDIAAATYFWAEEALYLLETGKLEVYCDRVAISAERARCLFLRPANTDEPVSASIRTCDVDEYTVFKYFSKLGYRLRRTTGPWSRRSYLQEDDEEEDDDITVELDTTGGDAGVQMEVEQHGMASAKNGQAVYNFENHDDLTAQLRGNLVQRKRRASKTLESVAEEPCCDGDESDSSSVVSMNVEVVEEEYDSDVELIGVKVVKNFGIQEDELSPDEEDTLMEDDEPKPGPSSAFRSESRVPYTVIEADSDSDLEILDESICSHGVSGVGIEEIESSGGGDSTGSGSGELSSKLGIVDLVSDSEPEECDKEESQPESESSHPKSYEPIWSQLVPNATLKMSFPPAYLLPDNIPSYEDRSTDYDCSNQGDKSELELESIVDGLRLDSSGDSEEPEQRSRSPPRASSSKSPLPAQGHCNSWKDWRQWVMSEARDVFNESLLGQKAGTTSSGSSNVMSKLHLWKNEQARKSIDKLGLRIPFYLFPPHVAGKSKQKLDSDIEPIYRIAIVRNDALIPVLSGVPTRDEDIPILFAILSDESDLTFVTCNSAPLPSLF